MPDPKKSTQKNGINADLGIDIKRYHIDESQLGEFIQAKKSDVSIAQSSLQEYVKEKFYKGQDIVVVPDLSNQKFESIKDISGLDFRGCKLTGAFFQSANLKGAKFCDVDLSNVTFHDCEMQNVDFRGSDLSNCHLNGYSGNGISKEQRNARFEGIKFSSPEVILDKYIKKNEELQNDKEQDFVKERQEKANLKQQKLTLIETEINAARTNLNWIEANFGAMGASSNNAKYNKLLKKKEKIIEEKEAIEKENFVKSSVNYIISPSLIWAMEAKREFDPAYIRGNDITLIEQEKIYYKMTRSDVENYIDTIKDKPGLKINEFTKFLMDNKEIKLPAGANVVADLSSHKLSNGEVNQIDLSGLNFTNARLQEACFSGAKLQNCIFEASDLSKAVFESADLSGSKFSLSSARDANFFCSNMSSVEINNCDFKRVFMRGSNAVDAQINNVNLNHSNIKYSSWDRTKIENTTFNYADLEGISLENSFMLKVQMQHTILDNAIFNSSTLNESDLSNALMHQVKAKRAVVENSVLSNIEAPGIDLTNAELKPFITLQGANLEKAILNNINAKGVSFMQVNMKGVNAELANFKDAEIRNNNLRFANLEQTILDNAKATFVDMTGANLTNIKANKANFSNAILQGIQADGADFTESNFSNSNLRGSNLMDAKLEKIDGKGMDLRNAELEKADFTKANIDKAKINDATNFHDSNIQKYTTKLIYEDINYREIPITAAEHAIKSTTIHHAEQKTSIMVSAGNLAKAFGTFFQAASEFIKQPLSNRAGAIAGALICSVAVAPMAATAAITSGLSITIAGIAASGVAIFGGTIGGGIGYLGAKQLGMTSTLLGTVGTFLAPGVGTIVSLLVGMAGNEVTKQASGNTIDGHIAVGINKTASLLIKIGSTIGLSKAQEVLLDNKTQNKAHYHGIEKFRDIENKVFDRERAQLEQQERAKQSRLGNEGAVKPLEQVLIDTKVYKQNKTSSTAAVKGISAIEKIKNEPQKKESKLG